MRQAGLLVTLLLIVSLSAFSQSAGSQGNGMNWQDQQTHPQTIQGCLTGSPDSYRLTERIGTYHLLMGDNKLLGSYVGQNVQLSGKRDLDRDASASSDEGTAHGMRFFRVDNITPTHESCGR
jgi:hypothetical protein